MRLILFFPLVFLANIAFADQGIIAKKPYHEEIYVCKKRTLYIAVDKLHLTTLESVLTKPWKDRVNPKILEKLDSEFIMDKMAEYDNRLSEVKKHFDIKFVDWYNQNITFHPAYRVGRGYWEKLPQGDYESHRWLEFWEWFIHEWDLPENQERWDETRWAIREKIYIERNKKRKTFIEDLIKNNPDKYEYTEYGCYDIDELGDCGYYWVYDKKTNTGVTIHELGYIDIPMPDFPPKPEIQICPLDPNFVINQEKEQ